MNNLVGRDLGRYHVLEQLGEGGMAMVYKAYDTRVESDVAIKVIRMDSFTPDMIGEALKRFEREAKALARLTHPNIVKVMDYGDFENQPFLVMPYLPGGTLKERISGRQLPYQEALEMLVPVARALDYAHRLGMIHRDIKPSNILITESGEPMLTDFGVAKILDTKPGAELTKSNATMGTPEYMAPEQVVSRDVDARTDIYALGVVLYEMVTGRKPFEADTPIAVLFKHASDPLPPPRQFVPNLPEEIEKILVKALMKRPEDRYQSMGEMARAMETLLKANQFTVGGESTLLSHPGAPQVEAATQMASRAPVVPAGQAKMPKPQELTSSPAPTTSPVEEMKEKPARQKQAEPKSSRRQPRWLGIAIGASLLVVLVVVGILVLPSLVSPSKPSPTRTNASVKTQASQPTAAPTAAPTEITYPGGELKVAILAPLSGAVPTFGEMTRDGALMAIEEWNARGGVLQKKVLPIVEDSQCTPDQAVNAANKVINQDRAHYIIGEVCSKASIPVSEIANAASVIQISPTSTNLNVTVDPNGITKQFIYRACFIDPYQGQVGATFAYTNLGARKAFVLVDQANDYVRGLAEVFIKVFTDLGGEIVGQEVYTANDTDFSAILTKVAEASPDVIYLPDYYNIVNLVTRQARDRGLLTPFLGGDGWDSADLNLESAAGGFFTNHYSPDDPSPAAKAFRASFEQRYGKLPDALATLAYDATNLLLQAIQEAGADDTLRVADVLNGIEFQGVSGAISFDGQHNPIKTATILRVTPEGFKFEASIDPRDCHSPEYFCVGMVTETGQLLDHSFNQSTWEGLVQAKKNGLANRVENLQSASPQDHASNISTFAKAGYDVIVTTGFGLAEATRLAAQEYPDTYFIGVDQDQSQALPNLVGLNFPEDEAGFLAGALASGMSTTHKIGAACGAEIVPPVWRYCEGYRRGAAYADVLLGITTDVKIVYHNDVELVVSFTDPAWGAKTADLMVDDGVDVLFGAAGETGNGAILQAASRGILVIGVDTDQYFTLPDAAPRLLSSAIKIIPPGLLDLIDQARAAQVGQGSFPGGNYLGQAGFAPYHEMEAKVPELVKKMMEDLRLSLADGSIKTGVPLNKP